MKIRVNFTACNRLFGSLALLGASVLALIALNGPARAQEEAPPQFSGPAFESFALIWQRNIFDASREKPRAEPTPASEPEPEVDEISLIGTLVTDLQAYAFFEGNRSELTGVVRQGGTLAGFHLEAVTTDTVRLGSEGQTIELEVGKALRREDGGDWKPTEREQRAPPQRASPLAAKSDAPEEQEQESSGKNSDILQRLMERRREELGP